MEVGQAARLRSWLEGEAARVCDADVLRRLHDALERHGEAPLAMAPHGTTVCFDPGPRRARVLEFDRHGTLLTALRWRDAGDLLEGWVRLAGSAWIRIEPRATGDAPWGISDRLWLAEGVGGDAARRAVPLTPGEALDWRHADRIPTLADPARLPPGAGSAVLNLLASLARDAGRRRVVYRGPYPSEQLFLTLLESFEYDPAGDDPLGAFAAGELGWRPAPHERLFSPGGVYVQLRRRVEKVGWRGVTYYRPDWQGVRRHAPRRLRDDPRGTVCSLWALDEVLENHLVLDASGEVVEVLPPAPRPAAVGPIPRAAAAGIVEIVVAASAAPLGPSLREASERLEIEWGPLERDLVAVAGERVRVSSRLRTVAAERLAAAPGRAERAGVALAVLGEIAMLLGDLLRIRAAERLATRPLAAQLEALGAPPQAPGQADARVIALAIAAMEEALAADGVQDQPDVEGDEGADRHR